MDPSFLDSKAIWNRWAILNRNQSCFWAEVATDLHQKYQIWFRPDFNNIHMYIQMYKYIPSSPSSTPQELVSSHIQHALRFSTLILILSLKSQFLQVVWIIMHSRSVLTTVIAFGAASSALAIPLPSSSALGGTVSSTIPALAPTTINARELELSVLDGNEWVCIDCFFLCISSVHTDSVFLYIVQHPLAHYAGELDKQHIDAVAQLLGKENVVVSLVGIYRLLSLYHQLTWILAFPQARRQCSTGPRSSLSRCHYSLRTTRQRRPYQFYSSIPISYK